MQIPRKISIIYTYSIGATLNRVVSFINVLQDYEVHIIGPITKEAFFNLPFLSNSNITVHYIPLQYKSARNFFVRYLQEMIYSYKCSKKAMSLKCDFELITIPFIALIITSLTFKGNATKILDIRDLVWEYLAENNFFQRIIKKVIRYTHLFLLNKYSIVSMTNESELKILEKDIPHVKKIFLSNGILKQQFNKIQETVEPLNVKQDQKIKIIYIGNIGIAQNLSSFIKAVSNFDNIELVIVGEGNDLKRLTKNTIDNHIVNVKFIGRVLPDNVIYFYNDSHFLWAKLDDSYLTAVPSKLYEYVSTGRPIIYSGKGAAIELLNKFENVFLINDDYKSIKEFLSNIQIKLKTINNSSFNINQIRENYIREEINIKLVNFLESQNFGQKIYEQKR